MYVNNIYDILELFLRKWPLLGPFTA